MAEIRLSLKPFTVPNYVSVQQPPSNEDRHTDAFHPLAALDANVLAEMCDEFRADVFRKAGKPDPSCTCLGGNGPVPHARSCPLG